MMSSRQPMASVDRGGARQDQVLGVAQPHISAVRETGQAQEGVKVLGLGVDEHPTGKAGAELRDGRRNR